MYNKNDAIGKIIAILLLYEGMMLVL